MTRKIMIANESGGVGGLPHRTLFPSVGMLTHPLDNKHVARSDEALLGPKLWAKLRIALAAREDPNKQIDKARKLIASVESTLAERLGYPVEGAFSHAVDGRETPPGLVRTVMDGNKQAFRDAFNSDFWSQPQGDRTIRDVNELLPEDLREINFGKPTAKVE